MNILIFDKNSREYKGNISQIASLIWTERYWEYGDFELKLPLTRDLFAKINLGDYFKIMSSDTAMVIEEIEVVSPIGESEGYIEVKGRSLESVLSRRVLFDKYQKSAPPSTYIPELVKLCFKDSKNGTGRVVDYLTIKSESDIVNDDEDNIEIDASRGDNLYDLINSAAVKSEIGFRITFDNNKGTMLFYLYEGKDKTYMKFDELSLTLNEAVFYDSIEDFKNLVVVDGQNLTNQTITATIYSGDNEPTGLNRIEVIETNAASQDEGESDKKFSNRLTLVGQQTLEDFKETITAEGKLLSYGRWKIRKDFDLGDIVTLQNDYFTCKARITEVIQSWDYADGYQIYPGFIVKDVKLMPPKVSYDTGPEPEPEPDVPPVPDIPVDQTPRKLINVELISAIKAYSNFPAGMKMGRHFTEVYIPNPPYVDEASGKDAFVIKRFAARLRLHMPEGWSSSLFTIYCDVFLGSETLAKTIKINLVDGIKDFVTEWYNYLVYDVAYIRLYLYLVFNPTIIEMTIPEGQEPYIDGFVDVKLNNVDGVAYQPSEEGDELSYQVMYNTEFSTNYQKYYYGFSTNVNGIQNVDIDVVNHTILETQSLIGQLGSSIDSGSRGYEYDKVELDNLTTTPIISDAVIAPPLDQVFDVPTLGNVLTNETLGNYGFRDNVFEFIKTNLTAERFLDCRNGRVSTVRFKKKEEYLTVPDKLLNLMIKVYLSSRPDDTNSSVIKASSKIILDNSKFNIKTLTILKAQGVGQMYFVQVTIKADNEILLDVNSLIGGKDYGTKNHPLKNDLTFNVFNKRKIEIYTLIDFPGGNYIPPTPEEICCVLNKTENEESLGIAEDYDLNISYETTFEDTGLCGVHFYQILNIFLFNQSDIKNNTRVGFNMDVSNNKFPLPDTCTLYGYPDNITKLYSLFQVIPYLCSNTERYACSVGNYFCETVGPYFLKHFEVVKSLEQLEGYSDAINNVTTNFSISSNDIKKDYSAITNDNDYYGLSIDRMEFHNVARYYSPVLTEPVSNNVKYNITLHYKKEV